MTHAHPSAPASRQLWRWLPIAAFCVLCASCAVSEVKPQVFSDYDRGTNFSGMRTFAWKSADPMVVSSPRPINPEGRERALRETVRQLEAKGFKQVKRDSGADLLVLVVFGSRDSLTLNNFPGRWGRSYVELRDTPKGGLGVEIFRGDSAEDQLLWTGWAVTGLTEEVYANRDEVISELLGLVLEEFPPRR